MESKKNSGQAKRMSVMTVLSLVLASFFVIIPTQLPSVKGYATPGTGVVWNFDDLVANSGGDVMGGGGVYIIMNTLTITGGPTPDTIYTRDNEQIFVVPGFEIIVDGIFLSQAVAGPVSIASASLTPEPGDWIGFRFNKGSIGRFENTEIRYARQGLRIIDADVTLRSTLIELCYPDAIYFEGGLLHINQSTILGSSPSPTAGVVDGGGAIYITGPIVDTLWINESTIVGGNGLGGAGGGGGGGGNAIFTTNADGPIGLIDNTLIQGGNGGYNNMDGMSAGSGGLAFHAFPVWDTGGPTPGISITGNLMIKGGNGGPNNASFDGSSGWGGPGIIISDDDYLGHISINNNSLISGGDGGDNFADWNVAGFLVGNGAPGISLDNVAASPGFLSSISGNALITGGKGGNNSGSALMIASAGSGGTALNLNDVRNMRIDNNLIIGGHGGNNTLTGMGAGAGQGGDGILTAIGLDILITNSRIYGGEGGDDYFGQGPGISPGPGIGGNGITSMDTQGAVFNISVAGGEGGDNYGGNGIAGDGGAGVYEAGALSLMLNSSKFIGGKGGDNYHDGGVSAGFGGYGIAIIDSNLLDILNSEIYGGAGGDCFAGPNARPGDGGSAIMIEGQAVDIEIANNPVIGVGAAGSHQLVASQGAEGYYGIDVGQLAQRIRINNNSIYNASVAGIYAAAPGMLIDGNVIDSGQSAVGIFVDVNANWANITNNPSIGNSYVGIILVNTKNDLIRNNRVVNTDVGIGIIGGTDILIDRTRVDNATTWAMRFESNSDRILVENSSIVNSPMWHFSLDVWSNATTLNTTFDAAMVEIMPNNILVVKNYLDILVLDQALAPIPNAEVQVLDNGNQVYGTPYFGGVNATTGPSGEVNWIVVTDRIYYGNPLPVENITEAEVYEGLRTFINNPRFVNMATSHQEIFMELGADALPPEVRNVALNGGKFVDVPAGTLVIITATLDDSLTGGSNVTYANYTVGVSNWPGTPMIPSDGAFDSSTEDVIETIDTTGWPPASYEIWVYGCDELNNCNYTGDFATLNITALIDNLPPEILSVAVNGQPSVNVVAGTLVEITATLDDSSTGGSDIQIGNYTIGMANWPGIPLLAVDGSYDSPVEDANQTIDTTGWAPGPYQVWVYACDVVPNCNLTGDYAVINIVLEVMPPEIYNVSVNGLTLLNVPAGTIVTLNATIDDTLTGGSDIAGANYTIGMMNWPGTDMNPADGNWDSMVENATIQVDTTGWNCGPFDLYVYGWDALSNYNLTSTAFATINITVCDQWPPQILQVFIDGSPSATFFLSSLPATFLLTAVIDDTLTGNTSIGGANYTMPAANWPGLPMNPVDGAFDTPWEEAELSIGTPSIPGTYEYCVYGWDQVSPPNFNTIGRCAYLDIIDDLAPGVWNVLLNGMPSISVPPGSIVTLDADVDDSATGGSDIWDSYWVEQGQPWPGNPMSATDGAFDSPTEAVTATIDTTGWSVGDHIICVNTRDIADNRNTTCLNFATLTITLGPDTLPPEVSNVLVDGAPTTTVTAGTIVLLTATIDDTPTGFSNVGGANFTIGAFNWPGTNMNPQDGAFDEVSEDVVYSIDTVGWAIGSYDICVYGWDVVPNYNTSSTECAQITIVGDLIPPTASGSPTGVGISITTNISIQFSEPMNTTAVEAAFGYTDLTSVWDSSDGVFVWSNSNRTMVFNPTSDLSYETTYLVTLNGLVAEDVAGNKLDGNADGTGGDNYTFAFKTERQPPLIDTTPPSVVDTSPADGATDISVDVPTIQVEFDEAVNETTLSVTLDGISIQESWDGNTLVITPLETLEYGQTYTVTISNAEDLGGNVMGDYEFSFTTEPAPSEGAVPAGAETMLWLILIVILVVIILILIFLLLRKGKPEEEVFMPMEEEEAPAEEVPYSEEEGAEPPLEDLHVEEEETSEFLEEEEG